MSTTNTSRVSHFWASHNIPFGSQGSELWEPKFTFWYFSLKAVYNFFKLQGLLQVAKFLFMYSFTPINIVFLFRHLPTKIVIFINGCYQISVVIVFPFLVAGFANIPPTFLISCEVQTRYSKKLKYSDQYIRDHLSGTKIRIWICSEYDAVFNFFCIPSYNLTYSFTLFYIIFFIRIRLWIFQTVNFHFVCF